MKTFFFGVISPKIIGHYLYDYSGNNVTSFRYPLPFRVYILDGGLLHEPEEQGRRHIAIINGWTILGMWDRSGDPRPGSNASFIFHGIHPLNKMEQYSKMFYPELWKRITGN